MLWYLSSVFLIVIVMAFNRIVIVSVFIIIVTSFDMIVIIFVKYRKVDGDCVRKGQYIKFVEIILAVVIVNIKQRKVGWLS